MAQTGGTIIYWLCIPPHCFAAKSQRKLPSWAPLAENISVGPTRCLRREQPRPHGVSAGSPSPWLPMRPTLPRQAELFNRIF